MAISFPAILLPPAVPAPSVTPVGAITAAMPAALLASEESMLPLPASQPVAGTQAEQELATMRPDQVILARQVNFPALRAESLAATWQSMVRLHTAAVTRQQQLSKPGVLSPAVLVANQEGRAVRPDQQGSPAGDWRFTINTGAHQAHTLRVLADEEERPGQRRRQARAALRLELKLADGETVVLQIEPTAAGLLVDLCASGREAGESLRALQPALAQAIARAGLHVVRWRFQDVLPAGRVHGHALAEDAAHALGLPVFRALAELALALPMMAGVSPAPGASQEGDA